MEIRQNVIDDLNAMTTESWRTIRIMAEMVQALDTLNKLDANCVSIFGSARSTSDSPEYRDAERLARMLVEKGFGVITGGGPGVMEAANKGAAAYRITILHRCSTTCSGVSHTVTSLSISSLLMKRPLAMLVRSHSSRPDQ